ncbi:MAG: RNA polymerase sigma factor [Myxococcota bacterium]
MDGDPTETHRVIEAIWRIEAPRLIARLARLVRDVGRAEELAQDALVAALESWPRVGVPNRPGAWLMATANHRAIDAIRRATRAERGGDRLKHDAGGYHDDPIGLVDDALDDEVGDDLLRLVFVACHPLLSTDARVALTLRLVAGLTTAEIARAFLVPEPTIAQRIVRAKRTLSEAGVPFEVPRGPALAERLDAVLDVIYLVYNEGYAATSGGDWMRPALAEDALRLGRVVAELSPATAEVHGLVALMELQSSRAAARVGPGGTPIRLLDQNRARWDQLLIRRGLAALARARALRGPPGRFELQAEIAACHARAVTGDATDWHRIAAVYAALAVVAPSPVVELNRAVAVSMADGPAAGLALVDALADEPALAGYHHLSAVRGDMLERLGRVDEARTAFERAAAATRNDPERRALLARAASAERR